MNETDAIARLELERDLDDITTAVFNAVENIRWPAFEPIDEFADLEGDGLERPIEDWKLIRLALEKMPEEAFAALCRLRGR